mgnify:CR=1 FL=1
MDSLNSIRTIAYKLIIFTREIRRQKRILIVNISAPERLLRKIVLGYRKIASEARKPLT